MGTKHYRDANGKYLGGFDVAPDGGIEVPDDKIPKHAKATWDGSKWVEPILLERKIKQSQLQKFFKTNNYWNFVNYVKKTNIAFSEAWEDKEYIDIEDTVIKIVSKGIGITKENIFNGATLINDKDDTPSTETELLEEAKNIAKTLVTAERERRKFANIKYKGSTFNVSEWDLLMISSLIQGYNKNKGLPIGDYWKTVENTYVHLDWYKLNRLEDLIREQIQEAYKWSWEKKAEIEVCTTVAEVESIDLELTIT